MTTNRIEDRAALGAYTPRGFTIELLHPNFTVNAQGEIDMPLSLFPTFMHEYAHLLQDRGTFRGVMDYLNMLDQVTAVAGHSLGSGDSILYPVIELNGTRHRLQPDQIWARELDRLRAMSEPRQGWKTNGNTWAYQQTRVIIREQTLAGRTIKFPFVYMDFIDNLTGATLSHTVGAWEIKEAYAVAVGVLHGGKVKELGMVGYEYLAIDRLLTYHFGEVSPRQTIALCHWALQDLSPATFLLELIQSIQEEGNTLLSDEEIFDLGQKLAAEKSLERNWHDLLSRELRIREFQAARTGNETSVLLKWLRERSMDLLTKQFTINRRFPLDTFLCRDSTKMSIEQKKAALKPMLEEVSIPIVLISDGSARTINSTQEDYDAVFISRAIEHLFHHVWTGTQPTCKCPFYEACNLSIKNDDCLTEPWLKGRLDKTCAYGIAAKLHGMQSHQTFRLVPFT